MEINGVSQFVNNTAAQGGGATSSRSGDTILNGITSEFNGNSASFGGAICSECNVKIEGSGTHEFNGNKATTKGGAIYTKGTLTMSAKSSIFYNNSCTKSGGVIYAEGKVTISSNTAGSQYDFLNNSSSYWGGAMYCDGAVEISGVSTNNFKENQSTQQSGGAFSTKGSLLITGSTNNYFYKNTAKSSGGAIIFTNYNESAATFVISGTSTNTFEENSAGSNGGAISAIAPITFTESSTNTFTGNTATSNGGAIYSSGLIKITGASNCTFQNNSTTSSQGGAICANSSDGITIDSTGIIVFGGEKEVEGKKVSLGNTAGASGGAIYSTGAVTLSNTQNTFSYNEAKGTWDSEAETPVYNGGGAIYSKGSITLSGASNTFSNNNASAGSGGAILANDNTVAISAGTVDFTDNSAAVYGGAIYAKGVSFSGKDTKVTFSGNTANSVKNDIYATTDGVSINGNKTGDTAGTYTFDGGITTNGGKLTLSNGANIIYGSGTVFNIGGGMEFNAMNLSFDMTKIAVTATGQFDLVSSTLSVDASSNSANTMTVGNMVATNTNNLSIQYNKEVVTKRGDVQTIIATTGTAGTNHTCVTGFETVNWTVANQDASSPELWMKAKGEGVVVLSPWVYNKYDGNASINDKDVSIHDAYYYNPTTSSNQSLTVLTDMTETQTTTLNNNTSKVSNVGLQSPSASEIKTVTAPSGSALFQNTEEDSTTNLVLNNINLVGKIADAKTLNLTGKNITFFAPTVVAAPMVTPALLLNNSEMISEQKLTLSQEPVVVATSKMLFGGNDATILSADTVNLNGLQATFVNNAKITGNVTSDSASKLTIGNSTTSFDTLNITGDYTATGTTLFLDLISTTQTDMINTTGEANLAGVTFNLLEPASAAEGDVFNLLTSDTSLTYSNLKAVFNSYDGGYNFQKNGNTLQIKLTAAPESGTGVPEPSTWALLILGSVGLWFIRRRNAKK